MNRLLTYRHNGEEGNDMKKTVEDMMVERYRHALAWWKEKKDCLIENQTARNFDNLRKAKTRALEDRDILIDIFGWNEEQAWEIRSEYGV